MVQVSIELHKTYQKLVFIIIQDLKVLNAEELVDKEDFWTIAHQSQVQVHIKISFKLIEAEFISIHE